MSSSLYGHGIIILVSNATLGADVHAPIFLQGLFSKLSLYLLLPLQIILFMIFNLFPGVHRASFSLTQQRQVYHI